MLNPKNLLMERIVRLHLLQVLAPDDYHPHLVEVSGIEPLTS